VRGRVTRQAKPAEALPRDSAGGAGRSAMLRAVRPKPAGEPGECGRRDAPGRDRAGGDAASDVDPNVTVMTGAFPAPGVNNLLSGTGRFAAARERARLSGAVRIHPDGMTATLSCIFVIDLYGPGQ
jgi:hypothetical protein